MCGVCAPVPRRVSVCAGIFQNVPVRVLALSTILCHIYVRLTYTSVVDVTIAGRGERRWGGLGCE